MPFEKGKPKTGGREKGMPNRSTREMREVIGIIISGRLDEINEVLEEVREKDPEKYLDLLFKLMRFVIAQKNDITSDDEQIKQPIQIHVTDPRIGEELRKLLE